MEEFVSKNSSIQEVIRKVTMYLRLDYKDGSEYENVSIVLMQRLANDLSMHLQQNKTSE
jgi:hypothetical protein